MQWQRLPGESKTDMPLRRDSSRRPLTTSSEPASLHDGLTQSDRSKKPHQGTKKTGERSTSTYLAKMGNVALLNGSSEWMEERWPDIPRMTRQGTFPSLPTSTPPKSTTTMTTMTPPGPYQHGSYLPWGGAAPPSPHSIASSTNSWSTIGVSWLRSTDTAPWMNSAKCCVVKSTSLNRSFKWLGWSGASVKGGLKQPGWIVKSPIYGWDRWEPGRSKTVLGPTWYARIVGPTMDVGGHADKRHGENGIG